MSRSVVGQPELNENIVVDTDVHVPVPVEEVRTYLESPYREQLSGGGSYGNAYPFASTSWDPYLSGKIDQHSKKVSGPEDFQRELCEAFSIDYLILNAMAPVYKISQSKLAVEIMKAYNDYLIDVYLDGHDNFYGLLTLSTHRPNKAAEEIDRLGDEDSIVGVFMVPTGEGATPPLGDESYDVIYEAASDKGLHVAYHASAEAFQIEFPRQNSGYEEFLEVHTSAHAWSQMMTLTSLIVNGVPEKFPSLNFSFLESGIAWIPYIMFRLNKEYAIRRSEAPLLKKSPEEYIRDSFFFSSQPIGEPNDRQHMKNIIDIISSDVLMYSSDYPHWDFDSPSELGRYLRSDISDEDVKAILSNNAFEAFGISP